MKKLLSVLSMIVLLACVFAPAAGATTTAAGPISFIVTNESAFPALHSDPIMKSTEKVTAGSWMPAKTVVFKNVSGAAVTIYSVQLEVSTDLGVFPFEVTQVNYFKEFSDAPHSGTIKDPSVDAESTFSYELPSLRCRGDAEQKYYDLSFEITYSKASDQPETKTVETVTIPILVETASSSGGGTTPKVIVTSSSTNPAQVVAGEDFTLNVTFQNTSGDASAKNIKAAISSDGTFTPVSGSSTLFIDALGPKASASKSIKLHAKADAAPGSYNASFALSYDAGLKDPVSDTEVISIPVKQVPKVQVAKIQLSSTDLFVGQDLNVMTSINNTGKSTLYNVNAAFTDKAGVFADGEQYLGNVQSGASGSVDIYLTAQTVGTGDITMVVTYEDENGGKFTYTDSTSANVTERTADPVVDPTTDPTQQTGSGAKVWIILALIVLAVAALIFFLSRRKQKKLKEQKKRDKLEAERLDRELMQRDEETRV